MVIIVVRLRIAQQTITGTLNFYFGDSNEILLATSSSIATKGNEEIFVV